METDHDTRMIRGAIAACILPMMLGFIGLGFIIYDLMVYEQYKYLVRSHHYVTRPTVACFILGTPLAAWMACRRLKKIDSQIKRGLWRSSAISGMLSATVVHIGAVLIFCVCLALFVDLTGGGYNSSQADVGFVEITFEMLVFNLIPWVIITVPLSLLCATIFWRVTRVR